MTQRLYTIHLVNCLDNKTVIDRRLRPRCCRMWSYFKRTSVSCRYIRRDIMCKHDVMNIQWCIAKNGGGYTQMGVAKGLKVPCLFMITEVSIRCPKKPGGWYTAYTRVYPPIHHCEYSTRPLRPSRPRPRRAKSRPVSVSPPARNGYS